MFYFNFEQNSKKILKTSSGGEKMAATAQSKFHYITRTGEFKQHKDDVDEVIEFTQFGNLPTFAENNPTVFWEAADLYERKNGRVCASFVVALPKELSAEQRIELAQSFADEFAGRFKFPYSCAIHNHSGAFSGEEQPHLHFMYSERSIQDGIERPVKQFFKRYNPKAPEQGGAKKLTADELNLGKDQLVFFRQQAEDLINHSLERYAPTKKVKIKELVLDVPNIVSCLSHEEYNKKYNTDLKDVPMVPKRLRFAKKDKNPELFAEKERMIAQIQRIRKENEYKLYQAYYEDAVLRLENENTVVVKRIVSKSNNGPNL